jgi:hypothetical protein
MAKTKGMKPRRIRSKEDRNAGRGNFITLKNVNDQFVGHALFKPDPEAADNPGWYEYAEHYTPATGYCPCAGEDCPLCDAGDNPSIRAKTLWLVDGEVKVFTLNWYMIQDFVDLASDDETILGRSFRIKRLEGNGKYAIRPKTEKLTKTELKAALKDVDDDMLEDIATKQMVKVLQELDVADAMEADDEDEGEDEDEPKGKSKGDKSKARKGKPADDDDEPEDEDEPEGEAQFDPEDDDEADDLRVSVAKAKKKDNILVVTAGDSVEFDIYGTDEVDLTEFKKGDELLVSFVKDDDGDFVVTEAAHHSEEESDDDEDEGESEGDGDGPDALEDELVTIVSVNSSEDTLTVKMDDDTEFDLFFLDSGDDDNGRDWAEFDIDDYKEGQKIKVTAARDDDGDMLASVFPEPVKGKGDKGGKSSSKKSGGKKKK